MTTQSYGPVKYLPLSGEGKRSGARLQDLRMIWEQAGVRPTIDPAMETYPMAETRMLSAGMKETPHSAGNTYVIFVPFKNEDERTFIDAYRSMLLPNMQHGKDHGLPKFLEGVNLQEARMTHGFGGSDTLVSLVGLEPIEILDGATQPTADVQAAAATWEPAWSHHQYTLPVVTRFGKATFGILDSVRLDDAVPALLEQTEAREVSTTPILDADHEVPSVERLPQIWADKFSKAPGTDVLEALRTSRFNSIAERLDYINAELADDPDWHIDQVHPDSIASFGTFLLSENPSVLPMVGLHPSGFVFAQWRVVKLEQDLLWDGGDGSLSMVFEPSNLVNYAASAGIAPDGAHTIVASGIIPVEDVKNSVEFFLSRAAEFDSDED